MKYRKLILTILIISLGKILSFIANTSRTHACAHACTHARTDTRTHQPTTPIAILVVAVRWVGAPNHDECNAPPPFRLF